MQNFTAVSLFLITSTANWHASQYLPAYFSNTRRTVTESSTNQPIQWPYPVPTHWPLANDPPAASPNTCQLIQTQWSRLTAPFKCICRHLVTQRCTTRLTGLTERRHRVAFITVFRWVFVFSQYFNRFLVINKFFLRPINVPNSVIEHYCTIFISILCVNNLHSGARPPSRTWLAGGTAGGYVELPVIPSPALHDWSDLITAPCLHKTPCRTDHWSKWLPVPLSLNHTHISVICT